MKAEGFIASRLRFKEKMAVVAIAISFLVMIVAVAISAGFRREIRGSVSAVTGDVLLTNAAADLTGRTDPICTEPSYLDALRAVKGVERIEPVIYAAGILQAGDDIHGVLFKGTQADTASLGVRVPSSLADKLGIPKNKVPYSARHTFSDKLKDADGTDKVKASLIGHSDYKFTQKKYQSTNLDELQTAMNSIK